MRLCCFLSVEIHHMVEDAERSRLKINLRQRISGLGGRSEVMKNACASVWGFSGGKAALPWRSGWLLQARQVTPDTFALENPVRGISSSRPQA